MVKIVGFWVMCCSLVVWADPALNDPTRPYQLQSGVAAVSVEKTNFSVTSILKRKNASWVVVNGMKASVGEQVGGARVVQIAYDKVLLDIGDSQRWVSLSTNSGLKKSR